MLQSPLFFFWLLALLASRHFVIIVIHALENDQTQPPTLYESPKAHISSLCIFECASCTFTFWHALVDELRIAREDEDDAASARAQLASKLSGRKDAASAVVLALCRRTGFGRCVRLPQPDMRLQALHKCHMLAAMLQ